MHRSGGQRIDLEVSLWNLSMEVSHLEIFSHIHTTNLPTVAVAKNHSINKGPTKNTANQWFQGYLSNKTPSKIDFQGGPSFEMLWSRFLDLGLGRNGTTMCCPTNLLFAKSCFLWQLSYISITSELYRTWRKQAIVLRTCFSTSATVGAKATSFPATPQVVFKFPPSLNQDTSDDITWSLHVKVQGLGPMSLPSWLATWILVVTSNPQEDLRGPFFPTTPLRHKDSRKARKASWSQTSHFFGP